MRLAMRQSDGSTLREHLLAAARATGQAEPMLSARVPPLGAQLWQAYCELAAERPVGMGASAVPSTAIESWQRLAYVRLTPWEVDTLRAMDHAALAVSSGGARATAAHMQASA